MQKKGKIHTSDFHPALQKARSYCAYQERYQQEVRDKLHKWGVEAGEAENIIARLITDNFLNEERFAKVYAGSKFRIKKWGRIKIKYELEKRKISAYCIRSAMNEIEEQDYISTLKKIIREQLAMGDKKKTRNPAEVKKRKIIQYCILRGYEPGITVRLLEELSA